MARGSDGDSALHRQMRLLDAFTALHPFLTLSELSRATDMSPSTVHRLTQSLEREGLLERMPDRTYQLGLRLWELAARAPGAPGLRDVARPWVTAAHSRLGQHTQLGVLSGGDVLFVDRLSRNDAVVNATLIGGRLPLHASSSGLVLLAFASEDVVDLVTSGGLRTYTRHTISTPLDLYTALRRVRADGFAVSEGHIHEESRGVSVPVHGPNGSVYAAIGVVGPNDATPVLPIVEVLSIAAKGIERGLAEAHAAAAAPSLTARSGISSKSWEYLERLQRDERRRRSAAAQASDAGSSSSARSTSSDN